jgi:hypothetical protein
MFSDLDSHEIDAAFAALRDRAPEPQFVPATTVRRRGRRRTHRQIAVAGIAVMGALSAAGALITVPDSGGRVDPAASQAASATPTATATGSTAYRTIPDKLMLRPEDVPEEFRNLDGSDAFDSGLPVYFACVDVQLPWESRSHVRVARMINFLSEDMQRADRNSRSLQIRQRVFLYEDGWATKGIADYQVWIDTCPGRGAMTFEVLGRNFVGDESVLFRVQQAPWPGHYLAIVRVGDRLTSVEASNVFTADEARTMAETAGKRLAG